MRVMDRDDHDEQSLDAAWRLGRRVATATAALGAALAGALHVFAGVSGGVLVLLAGLSALAVGSRLPAASPRNSLRRLRHLLAV